MFQGTGLVQFKAMQGKSAAMKLNHSKYKDKEITVQHSKFPLIPTSEEAKVKVEEVKQTAEQPNAAPANNAPTESIKDSSSKK